MAKTKIGVYITQESVQEFEKRPDLTRKNERVIKLFRGSRKAFEIWKASHGIPHNAIVVDPD